MLALLANTHCMVEHVRIFCMQEDGAKVRQQLTITRDGWGYLTRFTFGSANDDMPVFMELNESLTIDRKTETLRYVEEEEDD